ncbi:hypothetical protein [Xanthomonas oryzae]|uniref:Uncharacterized protein n=1 Tax=Xanthomonas oryzae pv. leersiae TaxID=3112258 RepID=A0AAJ6KMC2_9XANT|nr:hypothetical protein [Xanthomonas oryzae]WIX07543.1 hypothetical protein QN060_05610 [Xanthomonas oryzae pv. oryzae]
MPDPGYLARMFAQMKAMGGPDLPGARRGSERIYRWQHVESGRIVAPGPSSKCAKNTACGRICWMASLAGRMGTSRSWRLALRSLLGEGLWWFFP